MRNLSVLYKFTFRKYRFLFLSRNKLPIINEAGASYTDDILGISTVGNCWDFFFFFKCL